MTATLHDRTRAALDFVREALLDERTSAGHWEGELSSSALSTATAISAMSAVLIHGAVDDSELRVLITRGIEHLRDAQNEDGGFGDTDRSHSNIATSYLVLAASALADQAVGQRLSESSLAKLQDYLRRSGELDGLRNRYGTDKTFVVPILSNLAIAGCVDWKQVPSLPFEAAAFPQAMYRWLQMPVVSYAIPALVAIGQAKHIHRPTWVLPWRWLRTSLVSRTLGVLSRMQPQSGGYLEATPLTAFVVMSLASSGRANHPVCDRGLRFLKDSIRDDGSWPIDTNLATWVTSLSIGALRADPNDDAQWCSDDLVQWLLGCQHKIRHPFTGAPPGGWGWTDLTGAVPDGDDTPAAILALTAIRERTSSEVQTKIDAANRDGVAWLRGLQNRDGGMPTFCRGWGKLPFDRSSTDLSAHAMRAMAATRSTANHSPGADDELSARCRSFLIRTQQADGSWLPLWFGNQDREQEDNPIYGTSKVLLAPWPISDGDDPAQPGQWQVAASRGAAFLTASQNRDGGWGGGASVRYPQGEAGDPGRCVSTIEETALAVEGLIHFHRFSQETDSRGCFEPSDERNVTEAAIIGGVEFLIRAVESQNFCVPWPIGFYFAKLWYHERLYPIIFTASALGHFMACPLSHPEDDTAHSATLPR